MFCLILLVSSVIYDSDKRFNIKKTKCSHLGNILLCRLHNNGTVVKCLCVGFEGFHLRC